MKFTELLFCTHTLLTGVLWWKLFRVCAIVMGAMEKVRSIHNKTFETCLN